MHQRNWRARRGVHLTVVLLAMALSFAGCIEDGDDGNNGAPGAPGTSQGTVTGTITNSLTGSPVPNATVDTDPAVAGGSTTTDASGNFTLDIPAGTYTVTCKAAGFTDHTNGLNVLAGETSVEDVALVPTAPVIVSAGSGLSGDPSTNVSPVGSFTIMDGSTLVSTTWSQTNSVDVVISGENTLTPTVALPSTAAYKAELIHVLKEPPIAEEDLPPNIHLPEGEFPGGLPDRFMVVGLNHFALEEAGHVGLMLTVETTSGKYTKEVAVETHLPWAVSTSLRCVPVGVPILLHGKDQASYDWSIVPPAGSAVGLTDASTQNPYFTPIESGKYTVSVTDLATNSAVDLEIFAGKWAGGITADSPDGPVMGECFQCHGNFLRETFDDWAKTGHAHIFSENLDTSTHYSANCFGCHTVGFDTNAQADNGGFDDAAGYPAFLTAGLLNKPGSNWLTMLMAGSGIEDVANLGNIQCENCHGPNNETTLHPDGNLGDTTRASLSSDVCGSCHGEPLRHARFQQWQLSPHANYELAIDESGSGNCSRCHTGNGFVAWSKVGFDKDTRVTVTWDEESVHPQTCATCHDPHKQGQTSGEPNTATVRVTGDTPPLMAGFTARNVGRGAICIVCHNTRRGLINDQTAGVVSDTAPHRGAQGDMMMGQNAYFVQTGVRGKHSLIPDTCANCHMERTPPPGVLSYNGGGTNHTFIPSDQICSQCHDSIDAAQLKSSVDSEAAALAKSLEAAIEAQIKAHLAAGSTVELLDRPRGGPTTVLATLALTDTIVVSNFAEDHQDVDVTVNGTTYAELAVDDIVVNGDDFSEASDEAQIIVKSGWNLMQVRIDGSHGAHNPSWAFQIMAAAQSMLDLTDFTVVTTP